MVTTDAGREVLRVDRGEGEPVQPAPYGLPISTRKMPPASLIPRLVGCCWPGIFLFHSAAHHTRLDLPEIHGHGGLDLHPRRGGLGRAERRANHRSLPRDTPQVLAGGAGVESGARRQRRQLRSRWSVSKLWKMPRERFSAESAPVPCR